MKTFNKTLILSIFIISIQNTINMAQDKIKTFDLTNPPKSNVAKLSDLGFVDIEYIPLETKEQSLISGINLVYFTDYSMNKIIPRDGYYIIKNKGRVLKFREDGSFIASIGKLGRGPGEIVQIEDLEIDEENQNVFMVSGWQKKFCLYSPDGEFVNTFNVPFYIREFRFVEGGILCYCGNNIGTNKNSFILIDKLGHIIKDFPNYYQFTLKSGFGFTHENLFYRFNDKIFKKELYSDTVYVFENMDFKPHMVIEVGNRLITPRVRSESNMLTIDAKYIQPMNLFEFGDYVYYQFVYKYSPDVLMYGFIGSKKNDHQIFFDPGQGLTNDLDGGPAILPLTAKDDNTIVTLIEALTLKKYIATEEFKKSTPKFPEKKKDLEKLANSLKETDNPVLVLVKFVK